MPSRDTQATLRRAVFRIVIDEPDELWWGTGFFISPHGLALTAYHNLPTSVQRDGGGFVEIYTSDPEARSKIAWRPDLSQERLDLAVLERSGKSPDVPYLEAGYLERNLPLHERNQFWAGRAVRVYGFPSQKGSEGERLVEGLIDAGQPFAWVDEYDEVSKRLTRIERLRILGVRAQRLPGMSGGPVMDRHTGLVVAVDGSQRPPMQYRSWIYASELAPLIQTWPNGLQACVEPLAPLTSTAVQKRVGSTTPPELAVLPIHVSAPPQLAAQTDVKGSFESFMVAPHVNAVVLDNATIRFALRALDLKEEGSRFDAVHVACLQQLVEVVVLHDAILVPALTSSGWGNPVDDLSSYGIHLVRIPTDLEELLGADAMAWLEEWMSGSSARGLIARLLHIQKSVWDRKKIHIPTDPETHLDGRAADCIQEIWNEFVSYSSRRHLSGIGRTYTSEEWSAWLNDIRWHGISLLHWLVYRPFYYYLLSSHIWHIPYSAHPSRGMALTFDAFERRSEFARVALTMVAELHRDFASWVNHELGQRLMSARLPPIFRWVLNNASTAGDILPAALELRRSSEGRAFRQWAATIALEGDKNPNAAYQACIQLARCAQEVRVQWGMRESESDVLYALR